VLAYVICHEAIVIVEPEHDAAIGLHNSPFGCIANYGMDRIALHSITEVLRVFDLLPA
jgi:hypothetical protein